MNRLALMTALLAPMCSSAQSFGKWVGASDDLQVAIGVPSDSGALFGMNCPKSSNSCEWSLSIDIQCNIGLQTPVLASSRLGGVALTANCAGATNDPRLWRYTIQDASGGDTIANMVAAGGTVAIVAAMKDGKFSVYRFDVDNWEPAFKALEEGRKRLKASPSRDGVM